ncbi:MAG: mandelate racemase [Proteobacteria bacterium]|nr:mandelate racemase [Pseudomonadota bacterium]
MNLPYTKEGIPIAKVQVAAYKIPTTEPEADGTLAWDSTTLILVEISAGNCTGLGYTYGSASIAHFIREKFLKILLSQDVLAIGHLWRTMVDAVRNDGRTGMTSMAIAAVDVALWDLKARILKVPLVTLLNAVRSFVPVYGSGGFTAYSIEKLQQQLSDWVKQGIDKVKIKVGTHPAEDVPRVKAAREAIGDQTELFVDANGAYQRKQAFELAQRYWELGVTWFEEPINADDLTGLAWLAQHLPASMELSAGEYGYQLDYFLRLLQADAIHIVQADASRCRGITGFLQVDSLCQAYHLQLSTHTAPQLHSHVACAALSLRHLEYFYDHYRIEQMFFDGVLIPKNGCLIPDLARPGLGIEFKRADAKRYAI